MSKLECTCRHCGAVFLRYPSQAGKFCSKQCRSLSERLHYCPETPEEYREWWESNTEVPFGTCWCGCGRETQRANRTYRSRGTLVGQPYKHLPGHNRRSSPIDYKVDPVTECWNWMLAIDRKGYGVASVEGKMVRAHRKIYETLRGPIPEGLELDHLCFNPRCVNPDHLEPVTHAENIRRRDAHTE